MNISELIENDVHEPMAAFYTLLHVASGKLYVGSTRDVLKRYRMHVGGLKAHKHHNSQLQELFSSDPRIEFYFRPTETPSEASYLEQAFIGEFHGLPWLLNVSRHAGSSMLYQAGDETRKKLSQVNQGKILSEEVRDKMRLAKLGKKRPASVGEAVRKAKKANPWVASVETRQRMSLVRKGKKLASRTPEHIANLVASRLKNKERR